MKLNPFLISGYVSPEYFCDRALETDRLLDVITNQRHLTIFSPRRMGKTGLIRHSFNSLKDKKKVSTVYIDILATTSLKEFTETFGKAILSVIAKNESVMRKVLRQLSVLRLKFSIDPLTGEPAISFQTNEGQDTEESLNAIFSYVAGMPEQYAIAIDEFQQIADYPEKQTEALLRTHLQTTPNISFIFSGSRQHVLTEIFSLPGRPFFNSTEMMEIGIIDPTIYKTFIAEKFAAGSKSITAAALDYIEELTGMHTFYVQYLCNRLYGSLKRVDVESVKQLLSKILAENEPVYANYLTLLTPTQFRLLKAIARNRGVSGPTSSDFLSEHNLGAPSTVSQAIKSLTEKQFLYWDGKQHRLTDVFFAWWMVYK
ncbi:MAG: ATP-binding protein [Bacteroidales bacterium]|nr:ATP-binding protein [Bacteroidales bacterium]